MKSLLMGLGILAVTAQANVTQERQDGPREERALIAYMKVQPGTENQFLKSAENVIAESRRESGNLIYVLHQSVTNPQQFVFYELFKTNADMQYHRNARHVKDFLRETKPIVVENGFVLEEYELESSRP